MVFVFVGAKNGFKEIYKHSIMEYKKERKRFYIRLDKDESLIESIKQICKQENIESGYFQGIGACDYALIGTYIPEKDDFIEHRFTGMLEMVSLTGNVTTDRNNEPFLHMHAIFSYLDKNEKIVLTGGHLLEAHISYTGEIILIQSEEKIGRMVDPKAGIEVWKLS